MTHHGAHRGRRRAGGRRRGVVRRRVREVRQRPDWPMVSATLAFLVPVLVILPLMSGFPHAGPFPVMLLFALMLTGRHHRRRQHRAAGPGPAPRQAPPPPRPDLVWSRAHDRFAALRAEYAAHECDPMAVLRLPALSDVSVPSTARFVDAFAEAQALDTDTHPPADHATAFTAAADRAERAWHAARDAAERIRLTGIPEHERAAVERLIKLLTTARDSDNDAERLAAYTRARSELTRLDRAGVIHLPRPAQATLQTRTRGQLPA